MGKMKSHKGSKKRFKKTGKGKFKRKKGFKNHLNTKKSANRKRKLNKDATVKKCDQKRLEKLLPYE
ncbi:ribosomal protein L35 [Halobacteroides halobius DSM 5150]|uniref:Large ribosomal subunit protein bL35 n=1 Tax=Halobacteroides halobius (strain ATCC 35273 / DSM 5150 / MD-1) TaxID=748449 RepID=L0KBQ4_HALHC|nr:50S ribosomal protein L35 [Halobacteroides halobius]AGB41980.1 ribosomal protein L35 [Halobacteroides halobius DSM 5150]